MPEDLLTTAPSLGSPPPLVEKPTIVPPQEVAETRPTFDVASNPYLSDTPPDKDDPPLKPEAVLTKGEVKEQRATLRAERDRLQKELDAAKAQIGQPDPEILSKYALADAEAKSLREKLTAREVEAAQWLVPQPYNAANDSEVAALTAKAMEAIEFACYEAGENAERLTTEEAVRLAQEFRAAKGDRAKIAELSKALHKDYGSGSAGIMKALTEVIAYSEQAAEKGAQNQVGWAKKHVAHHAELRATWTKKINEIGNADAAEINAAPDALNSIISAAAKQYPEYAKTLQDLRSEAVTLTVGHGVIDPEDPGPMWSPYWQNGALNDEGRAMAVKMREELNKKQLNLPYQNAQLRSLLPIFKQQQEELKILRAERAKWSADQPRIVPADVRQVEFDPGSDPRKIIEAGNPFLK